MRHPANILPPLLTAALACAASGLFAHATLAPVAITPAALPDPGIAGFEFPLSEAALLERINASSRADTAAARADAARALYQHGWGLWTAVTAPTDQLFERQPLRVFETWRSLDDLLVDTDPAAGPAGLTVAAARAPRPLAPLRFRAEADAADNGEAVSLINRVIGFVKFNPPAADHIVRQQLLRVAALDALLTGGAVQVPAFPSTALVVKPIFQVIRSRDLVAGRYYLLRTWAGPPPVAQAWGPDQWTSGVWIDLQGGGADSGAVEAGPAPDGSTRSDATTYPLATFIHHRLSAADAAALNDAQPAALAAPGDTAVLVAMHVAGRELARWTWQTFWWTPDPVEPPLPSSGEVAGARPPQLQGAARHYAMAIAYAMTSPDQPYTGGANRAPAIYAYNPYIEARFAAADLPDSQPGVGATGATTPNNVGVQTNCMSCHAQATFHPAALTTAPRFTGARYVDLIDPRYVGTLQTEFIWSLPRHAR